MTYVKNISDIEITINKLGIKLAPQAKRAIEDVVTKHQLERASHDLIELLDAGTIEFLNADLIVLSKVQAIKFTTNSYSMVSIDTTDVPFLITTKQAEQRFYFVRDKTLRLNKGEVITKTFMGDLHTLNIFTSTDIKLRVFMNGLAFPEDIVEKNQMYDFRFDGLATNVYIELETVSRSRNIEIYMDGKSDLEISELQEFINNWSS